MTNSINHLTKHDITPREKLRVDNTQITITKAALSALSPTKMDHFKLGKEFKFTGKYLGLKGIKISAVVISGVVPYALFAFGKACLRAYKEQKKIEAAQALLTNPQTLSDENETDLKEALKTVGSHIHPLAYRALVVITTEKLLTQGEGELTTSKKVTDFASKVWKETHAEVWKESCLRNRELIVLEDEDEEDILGVEERTQKAIKKDINPYGDTPLFL